MYKTIILKLTTEMDSFIHFDFLYIEIINNKILFNSKN